ncbi:MAG: energy transducer TonB [Bacteroidales bacterium]|nr:energy transducer TonB [Candidatus Colicola faecequi]
MKKIFLIAAIALNVFAANAQTETNFEDEQATYYVMEKMPEFPGGQGKLFRFIYDNLQYPMLEAAQRHQGKTICQFVVERDGSISNVEIVRSSGYEALDNEALRIISLMPKWNPGGFLRGGELETRRIKYTIPITFKLEPIIVQPQFPGGADAQQAYLTKNMKYPKDAKKALLEGTAICQFKIAEDGSVKEPEVFVSAGSESLDKEALRLVSTMPKWTPGTIDEKPQEMSAAMFVVFSLPSEFINKQTGVKVSVEPKMDDRQAVGQLPVPACRDKATGEISLKVLIGTDGQVLSVMAAEGTTLDNPDIYELTRKAALKARFNAAEKESVGLLVYKFSSK